MIPRFQPLPVLLGFLFLASGCRRAAPPAGGGAGFAIQVVAVPARQEPVSESVNLVGSVAANESVEVKSEAEGTVIEIAFSEGQHIDRGGLLVALDETKFTASLNQAEASFKLARANHERAQQLYSEKLMSQQEFDQAAAGFAASQATVELMRRNLRDARITAPFSGTTGARQVSPGQVISKNTTLTWLVDLDVVKAEVAVPERYLSQIRTGQTLEFGVAAYPGERFRGEVYFISPQLDPATRTALVKARVRNPDGRLKGGMFASLALTFRLRESALVIPESGLMNNGDAVSVYVVDKDQKAQPRPVQVGLRLAGKAEITSGLSAGESVVVEGLQKLAPGLPVRLAGAESTAPYGSKGGAR
ncbi:MAG TPA: efflux transporter periplasmic adaptor subunit [Verrucomicrobiales bacterium]|nr:efflux transporter periplasmic adaptor subunit [Verrucomicrobiales bacterium]